MSSTVSWLATSAFSLSFAFILSEDLSCPAACRGFLSICMRGLSDSPSVTSWSILVSVAAQLWRLPVASPSVDLLSLYRPFSLRQQGSYSSSVALQWQDDCPEIWPGSLPGGQSPRGTGKTHRPGFPPESAVAIFESELLLFLSLKYEFVVQSKHTHDVTRPNQNGSWLVCHFQSFATDKAHLC